MTPEELLVELYRRGVTVRPAGDKLNYRAPVGVMTSELKQAMADQKTGLMEILTAEAPDDHQPIAVKVWSNLLEEALWVVADELPRDQRPTDAPVYSHTEVKILKAVTPKALAWVHLTKGIFMAEVVPGHPCRLRRRTGHHEAAEDAGASGVSN
jgi:hypothetical protein